jgi:hypothetical protein
MGDERYVVAAVWGDIAYAATIEGALRARAQLAADHRPDDPRDLRGITITMRGVTVPVLDGGRS